MLDGEDIIRLHDLRFKPFIDRQRIRETVGELGKKISADYENGNLVIIVVLKGAIIFAADLVREITVPCRFETLRARSYGHGTASSGTVGLEIGAMDIEGKDVLLVEDIVDTGLTLEKLIEAIRNFSPSSVRIAALLSKPEMHKTKLVIDYTGIEIPPDFVVGYGLDYAELGRNLPDIYHLVRE